MNEVIELNQVQKLVKAQQPEEAITIIYPGENDQDSIHMMVFPKITLAKRNEMIANISNMVVGSSDVESLDASNYQPSLINFARRYTVLAYMTNLTMPSDVEELYDLVMNTTVYEDILERIKPQTVYSIFAEADEQIEFYKNVMAKAYNFKSITKTVNQLVDFATEKFKDVNIEDLGEIMNQLKGIDSSKIIETILSNKNVG